VKEMRLQGIKSIEEGKRFLAQYLPGYNRRFAVKAKKEGDLHRAIPEGIELDNILCIRTQRGLRNDYTIAHKKKLYQIMDKTEARKVQVEEKINGTMAITFEGRHLKFKRSQRGLRNSMRSQWYLFLKRKEIMFLRLPIIHGGRPQITKISKGTCEITTGHFYLVKTGHFKFGLTVVIFFLPFFSDLSNINHALIDLQIRCTVGALLI